MAEVVSVPSAVSATLLGPVTTALVVIVLIVSVAILLVRRFQSRKQLSWEVLFDTKIGLVPERDRPPGVSPNLGVLQCLEQLRNVTVLAVRIRNSGRTSILAMDFPDPAGLRLEFLQRYILDFRVSEPTENAPGDQIVAGCSASEIVGDIRNNPRFQISREQLRADLSAALGGTLTDRQKENRRQFNFPRVDLPPGAGLTLIIDLHELHPDGDGRLTSGFTRSSEMRSGRLIDVNGGANRIFRILNRLPLPLLLLAVGALAILIPLQFGSHPVNPRYCMDGATKLVGSTAFQTAAEEIAKAYEKDCPGASIKVEATGSLEGFRELGKPGNPRDLGSFYDGVAAQSDRPSAQPVLSPQPAGIVIFSMVVNHDLGIDRLTVDQVRGIYRGTYKNWHELGAKHSLPIVIVSRNADSGTRQLFEKKVLGAQEPPVSSNSCQDADRVPGAPVIRCERLTTDEVLSEVDRNPGALAYADNTDAGKYQNIIRLRLGPADSIEQGYPFWTVEYLYTRGAPPDDSVLKGLIGYLSTDTARTKIGEAGYVPCLDPNGAVIPLCKGDH